MCDYFCRRAIGGVWLLANLVAVGGCEAPVEESQEMNTLDNIVTLTGEAFYRERIALGPSHKLRVVLRDVSAADKSATVVAEASRQLDGEQVPLPFALTVDAKDLQSGRYAVQAFIHAPNSQLEWVSAQTIVPESDSSSQNLGSVLLRGNDATTSSGPSGRTFLDSELLDRAFRIEDIAGGGVIDNSNVTVRFGSDGQQTGSGGCNQFFGPYTRNESTLEIGASGATQRACAPALMNQESEFFRLLSKLTSVRRDSQGAILLSTNDGRALRGFEVQQP